MATALKLRRGTTSQHASFTGSAAEVTVDTDKNTVVVHNGSTAGGFALMKETGTNDTKFRIDGSGNVGIGTSSPTFASGSSGVHINSATGTNARLKLSNGNTGAGAFDGFDLSLGTDGAINLVGWEASPMNFFTNGSERMRIDSSGNVGIGVSSPLSKLHVEGVLTVRTDSTVIRLLNASQSGGGVISCPASANGGIGLSSDGGPMEFLTNGTTRMTISALGVITSSGTIKSSNSTFLEVDNQNIYLRSISNETGSYRYTQKFCNLQLSGTGDPAFHYVALCPAYTGGGGIAKSYFFGKVIWSRGGASSGNNSSAVQVYVSSAYLSNAWGGVNLGANNIEIVSFTAGGVGWIGVRFPSTNSFANITVTGAYASSAAPAAYTDGAVSSVSVLKTLSA